MFPSDFIETARSLADPSRSEADRRTSVSRSYYGAFHCCAAMIPQEFAPPRDIVHDAGSHKALIEAMAVWGVA